MIRPILTREGAGSVGVLASASASASAVAVVVVVAGSGSGSLGRNGMVWDVGMWPNIHRP